MFKPEIIKGEKNESDDSINHEIITLEESSIEEEKIFTKNEILEQIIQIATQEGFKKDQIEIEKEVRDKNNNLIMLFVKISSGRARGEGWQNIDYVYSIKGNHGDRNFNKTTLIGRIYNFSDPEGSQGGNVAEYINGKWELHPNAISPKAESIDIDK